MDESSSSFFKYRKLIGDVESMSETPTDLISELPNSILFHILSFLSTKFVVQTSVISKRWRYLWTSVPIVNFEYDLFESHRVIKGRLFENTRFVDFVNKVLLLHDMSHIERFRLDWYEYGSNNMSHVNSWIKVAIEKNVPELDIRVYDMEFPHCLFTCKSLVSLKLVLGPCPLILPPSICFTKLRTLHLGAVIFLENCPFLTLISSCPVLENLIMEGCLWGGSQVVVISPPPSVRYLCIQNCPATGSSIKISVPNLTSFKYIGHCMNLSLEDLSSLIDASIDAKIDHHYRRKKYKEFFYNVRNLLRGVSNARALTLSDSTLEQLSNAPNLLETLPTFRNLNKLILTSGGKKKHFLVIAFLLRSAPFLESLLIHIKPPPNHAYKEESQEYSTELCLEGFLDHLKVMKIRCFRGTEDELEFVKLVLGNARTMERVIIIKGEDFEKRTQIYKKLLRFQRVSASCSISMP